MAGRWRWWLGREGLIVAAGVVLVAVAWQLYGTNRRLEAENRELRTAKDRPLLLRGAVLDLLAETTPILENPSRTGAQEVLVLIFSATCGICQENVTNWRHLVDRVPWRSGQEVWLITTDSWELVAPVVGSLQRRGVAYRVRQVENPAVFPYRTGIMGVPLTLVMEPQGTVQVVASGKLGMGAFQAIESHLWGQTTSRTARPLFAIDTANDVRTNSLSRTERRLPTQ